MLAHPCESAATMRERLIGQGHDQNNETGEKKIRTTEGTKVKCDVVRYFISGKQERRQ